MSARHLVSRAWRASTTPPASLHVPTSESMLHCLVGVRVSKLPCILHRLAGAAGQMEAVRWSIPGPANVLKQQVQLS